MKRNILNSPRLLELKKRRRIVFFNKILLGAVALAIVLAFLAYIYRLPAFSIGKVEVAGNKVIETEKIQSSVFEKISGNFFWFFPKGNIFFFPRAEIKAGLEQEFTRLKNISFSIKDETALEVSVEEREAKYLWCGTAPVSDGDSEKCYFMDESGFIFDEAPYFSGDVYFKFFGPAEPGKHFSLNNFAELLSFKDALSSMGLKPVTLSVEGNGGVRIFLSNASKTASRPFVMLKTDSDFIKATENLEAALSTEPLLSNFKNKYSSLEYIDLRFGNKVYYKFR